MKTSLLDHIFLNAADMMICYLEPLVRMDIWLIVSSRMLMWLWVADYNSSGLKAWGHAWEEIYLEKDEFTMIFLVSLPFRAFCVEDLSQIDDVRPLSSAASVRPCHAHHRRWCINRPSSSPITIMKLRYRKISWKSVYFRCFCGLWALWFRLICFRVICWKKICEDLSVTLIIDDDATIGHRTSESQSSLIIEMIITVTPVVHIIYRLNMVRVHVHVRKSPKGHPASQ